MAVFADKCIDISFHVVDVNKERITSWNSENLSNLPIFEPGLDQILRRCRGRNLIFSIAVQKGIADADLIFISVNTPTKTAGEGAGKALPAPSPAVFVGVFTDIKIKSASAIPFCTAIEKIRFLPRHLLKI